MGKQKKENLFNDIKKKTEAQASDADEIFQKRLEHHHDELRWLYMELYGNDSMFAELCNELRRFYLERNEKLKARDCKREKERDWYKQNDMMGMMLYIDNFAENMKGVEKSLTIWSNAM